MDLALRALSETCQVSGRPFQPGDRVTSVLALLRTGEYARFDLDEVCLPQLRFEGEGLCRWTQRFKPREATTADHQREMKLTAETLFLTLFEGGDEAEAGSTPLKQFLALFLERKRVLKNRGPQPGDERFIAYEHTRLKRTFPVPAGALDAAFFAQVRSQLGPLLGVSAGGA